ncbi:CP2 transcription factor-domain-containing protein [Spinellus fusiger]|nr:CP2 transcription factor-domain-containing protein [Spinellus fusiger]
MELPSTPDTSTYKHIKLCNTSSSLSWLHSISRFEMIPTPLSTELSSYIAISPHVSPTPAVPSSPDNLKHAQNLHSIASPIVTVSSIGSSSHLYSNHQTLAELIDIGFEEIFLEPQTSYLPVSSIQSTNSSLTLSPTIHSTMPLFDSFNPPHSMPFSQNSSTSYLHGKRSHSTSPDLSSAGFPTNMHSIRHHPRHQSANNSLSRHNLSSMYLSPTSTFFMKNDTGTPSSSLYPFQNSMPDGRDEELPKMHLRFKMALQANTAVTQKTEEAPVTYLNRGQVYTLQLSDRQKHDGVITSTLVIMFHDPSHRKVALNYWKFWMGQQKDSDTVRAVDIDEKQSSGIQNIRYPNFDRITFDWKGSEGAKIATRFNCLSTDFSRIKGVKGIPLRVYVESQTVYSSTDLDNALIPQWAGTLTPLNSEVKQETNQVSLYSYLERCFCKVKLFRDKGAERKNKDDAKQIRKQFDKILFNRQDNPIWLMYNRPVPVSILNEVPIAPSLDTFYHATDSEQTEILKSQPYVKHHHRIMTAPSALISKPSQSSYSSHSSHSSHSSTLPLPPFSTPFDVKTSYTSNPLIPYWSAFSIPTKTDSTLHSSFSYGGTPAHISRLPYSFQKSTSFLQNSPDSTSQTYFNGTKRSYTPTFGENDTIDDTCLEPVKRRKTPALSFYVNATMSCHSQSTSPSIDKASISSRCDNLHRVYLEELTVQELVLRLSTLFSLHPNQVSDVLWRRTASSTGTGLSSDSLDNCKIDTILVLVEDAVINQHILENSIVTIEWEIKADGTVRIVLQF